MNKNTINKILLSILLGIIFLTTLYSVYIYGTHYLEKIEKNKEIEVLHEKEKLLISQKRNLVDFSKTDKDIINKDFANKKYNKSIMNIETKNVKFIEKIVKKENNKRYLTVEIEFIAATEKDLRKYLVLLSLNESIYKVTNLKQKKDKLNIIELIYER